jgi:hypothetical protein
VQESTSPFQNPRSAAPDAQDQLPLGTQPFSPVFAVTARTPLLLLGAFSVAAMGCSFSSTNRETDGAVSTMAPESASQRPGTEVAERRTLRPSDDFIDSTAGSQQAPLDANASEGLVDALAASYAADMATLAEMQRTQRAAAAGVTTTPPGGTNTPVRATPIAPVSAAFAGETPTSNPPTETAPKTLVRTPTVTPTNKPKPATEPASKPAQAPTAEPNGGSAAPTPPAAEEPAHAPSHDPAHGTPPAATEAGHDAPEAANTAETTPDNAAGSTSEPTPANTLVEPKSDTKTDTKTAPTTDPTTAAATPASPEMVRANGALELPPPPAPVPTTPGELAKALAESLAKVGEESSQPMREWLAFAAIAVANPDIKLPENFGADLLPSERERITKAHAAFAKVGSALRDGQSVVDRGITESLIAALTGGPKLAIPKVDLCTRVDGFGRYTPLTNHKFLARANSRFIVYSELDGFSSEYTDGNFVTRLATRVSIESERDNIEVWQRSPEWTAVVDSSDVRRGEFFLCEIIPVSEYLSVGSYRLKLEVRDEATGVVAVSTVPIQVVADPSMAAAAAD